MNDQVHANDGDIGHVDGMLVDDQTWTIRYLVVNTSNWWFGHRVLIAPSWIRNVRRDCAEVAIHLSRDAIKKGVPFNSAMIFSRSQEADMYGHHEKPACRIDHGEQDAEALAAQ
jgi:hypothetical protein